MISARERRILSLALLVIGALGIAAAWPLATNAVLHGSAVAVSSVRYLAALAALGVVLFLYRGRTTSSRFLSRRAIAPLVAMGLTVAVFNLVFLLGLAWSSPSSGALIVSGVMPIAAAGFGRWWIGEAVVPRQLVGMTIAAAGVALVFFGSGPGRGAWADVIGGMLFVLGGVVWGVNNVLSRIALRHVDPLAATVWSVTLGLALLFPLALVTEGPGFAFDLGPALWLAVLLGLVSTALPLLCLMTAIALLGVTRTAASAFLVPIFAVLLDVVFLNQLPSTMESIGGAMAILGFVLIAR